MEKGTGCFSSDHLCIVLGRDTEFKKTKGTGGLIGRADAFVKVPGITHCSDNSLCSLSVSWKFHKKAISRLDPFDRRQAEISGTRL